MRVPIGAPGPGESRWERCVADTSCGRLEVARFNDIEPDDLPLRE